MKFSRPLVKAKFLKRYKRFFSDHILENGKKVVAHCANTGAMTGVNIKGMTTWLLENNNPKRKLKWSWELCQINSTLIGINTHLTNKIVLEALNQKRIKNLVKFDNIKTEAKFSDKTRFDFLISNDHEKCFLEVKNVTLVRKMNTAEFPDAITSRGTKHLMELIDLAEEHGHEGVMLRKNVSYEGKRTKNLLKCKMFFDAEYVVKSVDFDNHRVIREGKEVVIPMLAQAYITHKGHEVAVGSGWSQEQRIRYEANPEELIGKNSEIP